MCRLITFPHWNSFVEWPPAARRLLRFQPHHVGVATTHKIQMNFPSLLAGFLLVLFTFGPHSDWYIKLIAIRCYIAKCSCCCFTVGIPNFHCPVDISIAYPSPPPPYTITIRYTLPPEKSNAISLLCPSLFHLTKLGNVCACVFVFFVFTFLCYVCLA